MLQLIKRRKHNMNSGHPPKNLAFIISLKKKKNNKCYPNYPLFIMYIISLKVAHSLYKKKKKYLGTM